MNPRTLRLALVGGLSLLSACNAATVTEPASSSESPVIEGNLDPLRYPAMGYLVYRINVGPHAGEIFRPNCGATLIAARAIITATHCAEDKWGTSSSVVAVGFGDGIVGPTYDVLGTWEQWVNPRAFASVPSGDPDVPPYDVFDMRNDIAVIGLKTTVVGIEPMPIRSTAVPLGSRATVIGYGRVVPGQSEASDSFASRPDHRDRYPGLRKSFDVSVAYFRELIEVDVLPDANGRRAGGISHGDSGSALILDDGTLAATLSASGNTFRGPETPTGPVELPPGDQVGKAGTFTNLQRPENIAFIQRRLAEIDASQ